MEPVRSLLRSVYDATRDVAAVILFGEIYGSVQSLRYGHEKGAVSYRAFDISVNGRMMDWDDVVVACEEHGVETVPLLYRGPFSVETLRELSGGDTTLGGGHMREGVVVHPAVERRDERGRRVMLKRLSDEYRLRAERISDSH